jgi:ribosomal protein S27E
MPVLGEIQKGKDIGKYARHPFIWIACPDCMKERWVRFYKGKQISNRCRLCSANLHVKNGEHHCNWKNGRWKSLGYVRVSIENNSFFYPMAYRNRYWIFEHRLVMAQHLGRCLQPWELIHHKNGIKDDNRIENLELTTQGNHIIQHGKGYSDGYDKGLIDGRNKRIQELENEIRILKMTGDLIDV